MTNEEMLDRYEREYVKYHKISAARWRQQRKLLLEFAASFGGALDAATFQALQTFAGDLVARDLHPNTVRKKLNQIRPFYSWAYAAGVITAEQYVSLRAVKDPRGATANSTPNPYNQNELRAFWAALDAAYPLLPVGSGRGSRAIQRWREGRGPWGRVYRHAMRLQLDAMVRLALDCGLRRQEIYLLDINDMSYENEYLVVWRAAKGKRGVRVKQEVPFTTECRNAVYRWLEFRALMAPEHDKPWLSLWGEARAKPMHWTRFQDLLRETIGQGWEWHRFRHTCATLWLRAGMELESVSRLLGHANLQQTLAYAEILKSDIQKQIDRHEDDFEGGVGRAAA